MHLIFAKKHETQKPNDSQMSERIYSVLTHPQQNITLNIYG